MGDDTLYSGTVAAATEGYLLGVPAVAFSLNDKSNRYWDTAEKALFPLIQFITQQNIQTPVLWNINIPAIAQDALQGVKVARLGRRHHGQGIMQSTDPRGEPVYWIGTIGKAADDADGTDFAAIADGFVSITPLTVDLSDKTALSSLAEMFKGFQVG